MVISSLLLNCEFSLSTEKFYSFILFSSVSILSLFYPFIEIKQNIHIYARNVHASLCHYCKTLHYFAIMLLHSFEDKLDLSLRKSIIQLLSIFLLFFGAMSRQTKLCIMHGTGILLSQRNSSDITSDKEFLCSSHYLKHGHCSSV